jgi:hypothetical protein
MDPCARGAGHVAAVISGCAAAACRDRALSRHRLLQKGPDLRGTGFCVYRSVGDATTERIFPINRLHALLSLVPGSRVGVAIYCCIHGRR